jgi:hypothetical protein
MPIEVIRTLPSGGFEGTLRVVVTGWGCETRRVFLTDFLLPPKVLTCFIGFSLCIGDSAVVFPFFMAMLWGEGGYISHRGNGARQTI